MIDFVHVNWLAILACVVTGQIFLTVWFAVVFARPWAEEYGAKDPKEHTKAIPPATYGIGAACVLVLSLTLAGLQNALSVTTLGAALGLGIQVAVGLVVTTALPGYAFLQRYRAFGLALGAQVALVLLLSLVLVALG